MSYEYGIADYNTCEVLACGGVVVASPRGILGLYGVGQGDTIKARALDREPLQYAAEMLA